MDPSERKSIVDYVTTSLKAQFDAKKETEAELIERVATAVEKRTKEHWARHPMALLVLGFFLTSGVGYLVNQLVQNSQTERDRQREDRRHLRNAQLVVHDSLLLLTGRLKTAMNMNAGRCGVRENWTEVQIRECQEAEKAYRSASGAWIAAVHALRMRSKIYFPNNTAVHDHIVRLDSMLFFTADGPNAVCRELFREAPGKESWERTERRRICCRDLIVADMRIDSLLERVAEEVALAQMAPSFSKTP